MKIVFRNRVGETITRDLHLGSKQTVGLRLDEVIFESREECVKIVTDDCLKKWWMSCVVPAMLRGELK